MLQNKVDFCVGIERYDRSSDLQEKEEQVYIHRELYKLIHIQRVKKKLISLARGVVSTDG